MMTHWPSLKSKKENNKEIYIDTVVITEIIT